MNEKKATVMFSERVDAHIFVSYHVSKPTSGEVIEADISDVYVVPLEGNSEYDSMRIELLVRKMIATTLLERAKKGDSRFAYDAPAVWVEITSLGVQVGDSSNYEFPKEDLLTPKQLALTYQRSHLRAFWDKLGITYKDEVADVKKTQH